ncbi:MAG: ABC transporter permease, partial [Acidimicrobiales bacterium]|nr:ABC transporter permease [Acidimicrobiales bacterium]
MTAPASHQDLELPPSRRIDWREPPLRYIALAVGVVAAWLVLQVILPNGLPLGVVVLGVVLGSLTGLTAIGLILIYQAARVINFAQAALGSVASVLAIQLVTEYDVNYFLGLILGVAVAALMGAVIDMVIIRRFMWAPRMILTLATIGLAQILGGLELLIPRITGANTIPSAFDTPLSARFEIKPVLFTGNHLMIVLVSLVVIGGLGWFLIRTDVGTAIRAVADNGERARLMGIPVKRLSTIVWVVAAVLSALASTLAAPIQGLTPGAFSGSALLLPALAAAVLAKMTSLPGALAAGMGLGVLQQGVFWNTSRGTLTDLGMLVVILVALFLQRDELSRSSGGTTGSWVGAQETPPVPAALALLPEIVWMRRGLYAGAAGIVAFMALTLGARELNLLGSVTVVYAVVAVSLVVLTGWTGQISLGQFAIAGVGAVVAGYLLADRHADLFLSMLAAAAAGALVALVVGLPALRIRGLFLAVTTLALAVPMSSYFLNPTYFADQIPQQVERPVVFDRIDLADERMLFLFCVATLVLVLVAVRNLRISRTGRVLVATRDNEMAVQARGVSLARSRLLGFVVSGALAGLGGALHVVVLQG